MPTEILNFVVCTVLLWATGPILLALALPLYLYRFFLSLLQKLVHPRWIGILSIRDVVVSENPRRETSNFLSVCINVMSGKPNVRKIRDEFMRRIYLHKNEKGERPYRKFGYFMEDWMGHRFWREDPNFNIENHIKVVRLKKELESESEDPIFVAVAMEIDSKVTGNEVTEEQLYQALGDLGREQLPPGRPQWDLLIIPNYVPKPKPGDSKNGDGPEPKFVMILRFQHAMFDGFSLKKMMTVNMIDHLQSQKENSQITVKTRKFPELPNLWSLWYLGTNTASFFFTDRDKNDWHHPGIKLSERYHTYPVDYIPFNLVQRVGKKMGVTSNVVIFGALTGAIIRFWKIYKNQPAQLPKYMRVIFPWSVDGHPMDGLVNHWSYGEFRLPLHCADESTRFKILQQQFEWQRNIKFAEINWWTVPLLELLPNWMMAFGLHNRSATLAVSNFPGPREKLTFFGEWPLDEWLFCSPRIGTDSGLQFAVASYAGRIGIVLTINRAVMSSYKEVEQFGRCIHHEFLQLEKLIK